MSGFKETFAPKEGVVPGQHREIDRSEMSETYNPHITHNADFPAIPFSESSDTFTEIYSYSF